MFVSTALRNSNINLSYATDLTSECRVGFHDIICDTRQSGT